MTKLLVTSNLKTKTQKPLGLPRELRLTKLPQVILDSFRFVRFADLEDVAAMERATSEVYVADKLMQRTGFTRGGQSWQQTLKADDKRANDTNMALRAYDMPVSKAMVAYTALDVNRTFDEQGEAGLEFNATIHRSSIGMNSLVLAPACMSFNVQAGARLQQIFDWRTAVEERKASATRPLEIPIHHVHLIAPWLSELWFGGVQKGLYTRGRNVAVTVNTRNYIGLWKKPFLYAHEWFCMNHRPEIGILHAGACRLANGQVMVLTGPSALGKTEISAPLTSLKTPGKLEFVDAQGQALFVEVGNDQFADKRQLIVDDMVAFYVDSVSGEMRLWDLETGHYVRFDLYNKKGDHPTVDHLAKPGCTIPCSWSNVKIDAITGLVIPEQHLTLDGQKTDNPRVVVETKHLPAGHYEATSMGNPVTADILAVGIPSAPDVKCPTFAIVNNRTFMAIAVSGLRANQGNQSIQAEAGNVVWVDEGAYTLPPFGDITEGEIVSWLNRLIQRLSPNMLYAMISNRSSFTFSQRNKYDGTWFFRWLIESGVDFKKGELRRHQSLFGGWCPVLPAPFDIYRKLVDPQLALPDVELARVAELFDQKVLTRLGKIDLEYTLIARQREELRRCRAGKIGQAPFEISDAEFQG